MPLILLILSLILLQRLQIFNKITRYSSKLLPSSFNISHVHIMNRVYVINIITSTTWELTQKLCLYYKVLSFSNNETHIPYFLTCVFLYGNASEHTFKCSLLYLQNFTLFSEIKSVTSSQEFVNFITTRFSLILLRNEETSLSKNRALISCQSNCDHCDTHSNMKNVAM